MLHEKEVTKVKIIKRDGREAVFDSKKIESAILAAAADIDPFIDDATRDLASEIASNIEEYAKTSNETFTVEKVQDFVENNLMASERKDIARVYITYRTDRTRERERTSTLMQAIGAKLNGTNIENQNANVDEHSFGGRMGEARSIVVKQYALDNLVSPMAKAHHENNEIYIHDLDSYAIGEHNCADANTRFVTDQGIRAFKNFKHGDKVTVLAADGQWREATVKMYGKQQMYDITMHRLSQPTHSVTLHMTRNHRWLLADGTVTDNLQPGDLLLPLTNATQRNVETRRDAQMFALGFTIGDGTDSERKNRKYLRARLCGSKARLLPIFETAGWHVSQTIDDDIVVQTRTEMSKSEFLNSGAWRILSPRDKQLLFDGYMAADGSTTTNTQLVWTSNNNVRKMINEISAIAGYHIYKERKITHDTNYKKNAVLYEFTFTTQYSKNSTWIVDSIKKRHDQKRQAWCVEEPVTHSFTLEEGIVTGNCLSIPIDNLLANGFNTRQTDVRPAGSVKSAMQLVAVIFQLQSLCQFGGVAATHLDWSMVPYVRKSFSKHYRDGMKYLKHDTTYERDGNKSIVDATYLENKDVYDYAMDMTIEEVHQATEAMFHNLNLGRHNGNIMNIAA